MRRRAAVSASSPAAAASAPAPAEIPAAPLAPPAVAVPLALVSPLAVPVSQILLLVLLARLALRPRRARARPQRLRLLVHLHPRRVVISLSASLLVPRRLLLLFARGARVWARGCGDRVGGVAFAWAGAGRRRGGARLR